VRRGTLGPRGLTATSRPEPFEENGTDHDRGNQLRYDDRQE
jgi:hypothetical protein